MQRDRIIEQVNEVFQEDFEMELQQLVPEANLSSQTRGKGFGVMNDERKGCCRSVRFVHSFSTHRS